MFTILAAAAALAATPVSAKPADPIGNIISAEREMRSADRMFYIAKALDDEAKARAAVKLAVAVVHYTSLLPTQKPVVLAKR